MSWPRWPLPSRRLHVGAAAGNGRRRTTVAKNGVPVWTMIAENEGHGFVKKENADYLFYARALFLETFLLGK